MTDLNMNNCEPQNRSIGSDPNHEPHVKQLIFAGNGQAMAGPPRSGFVEGLNSKPFNLKYKSRSGAVEAQHRAYAHPPLLPYTIKRMAIRLSQ
ncbi:hypothetical protein EVAR_92158_1 [Eumeta japonica]|uniref:Uncharacterized protein n=1 Tax=Eumeta variegata TaxID=151549 RepID=A0A4C1T1Z2_EUMVA|nr:hypothetical protein EVAR_92158_1 [Eumeta japonica]